MGGYTKIRTPHTEKVLAASRVKRARGGSIDDGDRAAVHAHEKHDHPGKPLTKLKHGGKTPGGPPTERLDKRARGGSIGHRHPHKGNVNVIVHAGQSSNPAEKQMAEQAGMQKGVQVGAAMGAKAAAAKMGGGAPMPGAPPMGAAPPMGGAPPGPPPMPMGPPMRKRGGHVPEGHVKVKQHIRRKSGGACE